MILLFCGFVAGLLDGFAFSIGLAVAFVVFADTFSALFSFTCFYSVLSLLPVDSFGLSFFSFLVISSFADFMSFFASEVRPPLVSFLDFPSSLFCFLMVSSCLIAGSSCF